MAILIGLCVLAVWMAAAIAVQIMRGDLFDFASNASYGMGRLTALVVFAILLVLTVKEILKRWPQVMEERRLKGK